MSTGLCFHVLWITLQILVFAYRDRSSVMASARFTPYVSEFEYASRFHPSKNPDCPTGRLGNPKYRRSPEEGPPVGQEPSIEVRAMLVRCPKSEEETDDLLVNRNVFVNITAGRSQDILDFHGFDTDEPTRHSEVRDCRRKIIITMKFNNIGRTKTQEEFVVIDHVLDPVTMHKARLLNPFVVKVRQEPVLQLYGLKFQGLVNAEAREEVITNKQSNYTGCDDTSDNPTCGQMIFEDKPIPYSQGFCCSCDPEVNIQRQASILNESVVSSFPSFFPSSKDRSIRPFKMRRSVKTNFLGDHFDTVEIKERASVNKGDSYEDERDLKSLKTRKRTNEEIGTIPISRLNDAEKNGNKIMIDPGDSSVWKSTNPIRNSSETRNTSVRDFARGRKNDRIADKDVTIGIHRNDHETLSKREPTANLINELTKLEEDYKNFRISSIMRAEGRNDRARDKTRLDGKSTEFGVEQYSGQRSSHDNVEKFQPIENSKIELFQKNNNGGKKFISIPISMVKVPLPIDKMIDDRSSTLSIDVKLALVRTKNSTSRGNSSLGVCSGEILQPTTTSSRSFSESHTPTILWQKIASDRVYPSSEKNNVSSENLYEQNRNFYPAGTTTDMSRKFDENVADLLANAVTFSGVKLVTDNSDSIDDRSSFYETTETTILENFVTTISETGPESTELSSTINRREDNEFTTSLDELSSRAENSTDSSPSFSSGNRARNGAIVLSGSLRNQLGNWLTYDARKKYESSGSRKKSRERNYERKIEGERRRGEHGTEKFASSFDDDAKKHDVRDDRTNRTIIDRIPMEIHSGMKYDNVSSSEISDSSVLPKSRETNEKSLREFSSGYSSLQELDEASRKGKDRLNGSRSYRSIAETDRFFVADNDRQKNIDKEIEDEFREISHALKDAADGPMIARPKSDATFDKDDSVIGKIDSDFDKNLDTANERFSENQHHSYFDKDKSTSQKLHPVDNISETPSVTRDNGFSVTDRINSKNLMENRTDVAEIVKQTEKFVEPISEIPPSTEHQIVIDRFKLVNDFTEVPIGLTNVTSKIRDLMESTIPPEHTTIIQTEFANGTISSIPRTTTHRINFNRFKIASKLRNAPQKYRNLNKNESLANTSLSNLPSSISTIENLKKKLQNEAKRYSLKPRWQIPGAESDFRKVDKFLKYGHDAREINTELTPAEKVEDSITDEETLPPDEATTRTISFERTATFPPSVTMHPLIDSEAWNSTVFPRFAIRSSRRNFANEKPAKKFNKVFLLLEESSPSSSPSYRHFENRRGRRKKNHRLHYRRKKEEDNLSTVNKRNIKRRIVTTTRRGLYVQGKVENEDDEGPWYETTFQARLTVPRGSKDATTKLVSSTTPSKRNKVLASDNPEVTESGRSKRNLQIFTSRTFRSFYPKSSDFVSMSENEGLDNDKIDRSDRNSRGDVSVNFNEKEPEALIFYDYENEGESPEAVNLNDKRSLDNSLQEEMIGGIEPSEGWKEKMELLKLKKHADVLKEYLNWRHDVAPPESHEVPGYTTRISMTTDVEEETNHFVTTAISSVADEMTLPSTESTYSTITKDFSTTSEQSTETVTSSTQQNDDVEETTHISTFETSSILPVTNDSNSFTESITTEEPQQSTGRLDDVKNFNTTPSKIPHDGKASTGRILPPCGSEFPKNSCDSSSNRFHAHTIIETSPITISDHRGQLQDVNNDLVIISVMEKNRLRNRKHGHNEKGNKRAEIYKISNELKLDSQHRRHRSRNKNAIRKSEKIGKRQRGMTGRRLMSVQAFDENNDSYEDDLRFEDREEINYSFVDNNTVDPEKGNEMFKHQWNELIDKVVRENSTDSWHSGNSTNASLTDVSGDDRSVLKKLHFYNADKYIKKIAKDIVHNGKISVSKNDEDLKIDKVKGSRFESTSGRQNRAKSHSRVIRRKLNQYHTDGFKDFKVSPLSERSKGQNDGRDFAISLSGKIHVEGGTNGLPMSISFDTSPEIPKTNETVRPTVNESLKIDDTKIDVESRPSTEFLSSVFNIAPPAKDLENTLQNDDKTSSNFNTSIHQNVRTLRENRKKGSYLVKKTPKIRRTRAVDPKTAERYSKYRDDRSYDSEDLEDSQNNAEDFDVNPESSIGDDNDFDVNDSDDLSVDSIDHQISGSGRHFDNIDENHNLENPEIGMIRIIPLNVPKSSQSFSDSRNGNQLEVNKAAKVSRMTASQLPKMADPLSKMADQEGTSTKTGKIVPAESPWRESETDDEKDLHPMGENLPAKSECCSSKSSSENLDNSKADGFSMHQAISTANPVNLRVLGLVSMKEPLINEPRKVQDVSNKNYEIVPLIHVKIQQQPVGKTVPDRNYVIPLPPNNYPQDSPQTMGGCTRVEANPMKNIPTSLCSRIDDVRAKIENEDNTKNPVLATLNMDNDEELREPMRTCPESEINRLQKYPSCSNDHTNAFGTTTESRVKIPCQNSVGTSEARKKIRRKNMLAILEFMKKINKIMNSDERMDFPNEDYNDAVINLEKVMIFPNNRINEISGKSEEPDITTHRVVVIGEGVKHDRKNFGEPEVSKKSSKANRKVAENDQDQSFLFYPQSDEHGPSISRSDDFSNENRVFDKVNDTETTSVGTKEENVSMTDPSARNWTNTFAPTTQESPSDRETTTTSNPRESDKPIKKMIMQNVPRNIDDNNPNFENDETAEDEGLYLRKFQKGNNKKRNSIDFSSLPKLKRRRSPTNLASHRSSYDNRDERYSGDQFYRSRLSPSGGQLSRLGGQNFGRFAAARRDNPREKRRKKRRRKKKKGRKKTRKQKKKGKGGSEAAASKGKSWWPFGRQLMSLGAKRRVTSNSNFDRRQIERAKTKKRARRRIPFSLKRRKTRRVHRTNYPHGAKRKEGKRRKHKKGRAKKKKAKKTKKTKNKTRNVGEMSWGRTKRQIEPGGAQTRGGQDCMDRRHPFNVNPAKYLESAHCLRFSDLWYSVYELDSPIMEHTVYLQLFEKHSLPDGTTRWVDLTQGTMVRMGTFTRHQRDNKPTIVFTYSGAKVESQKRALNLDPTRQRLLVPSPVPPNKAPEYPEVRGTSGEYLVVSASVISKDGNECDKAGVNFATFAKQDNRCGRAKDSCLKNQPLAYWRHDMEARDSGRPGCYFLSNFASVPTSPIKYNVSGTGSQEYLGLEYHSSHVSAIDIEVRTDYNAIVRVGSSGRVTEVYIDSTSPEHTVVTVVISNMGLASSPYQPRITDCPTGLPVAWTKAKGIMQVIPPQHDQRVTLDLYGQLLLNGFHCSVEVVNHRGELVAMRRIRIQKMDRCFCVWHCLCACIGSAAGMGCQPMSPEHYHAAGFQGPVPVITAETSILMNVIKDVLMLGGLLVLLLLLLGLIKWFVGLFAPRVGRWGLESLLVGSKIEKYFEPELSCRCPVTDDSGVLVHPDTGQRTVRLCSRKLEFLLNLIFFLTYPMAMCCNYIKSPCQSSRQRRCCPDESKTCLINDKSSCPKMICVSTYGDSRNSRLEAEDTRYVMNELKKSQESLETSKGAKKKVSHRRDKTLSQKSSTKNKGVSSSSVRRLVDDLLKRRTVFRNLNEPIGGLAVPSGVAYSLRGYFLNAENGGYRFITPCPFKQYWLFEKTEKKSSKQPVTYPSSRFMRSFETARDVYESDEISLIPIGVCINVRYLEDE